MARKRKMPTEGEGSVTVPTAAPALPKKARIPRAASASVGKGASRKKTGIAVVRQPVRSIPARRSSKSRSRFPKAASVPSDATMNSPVPDREEISLLAYSYWEARGCQGGSAEEDWRRAEMEIQRRREAASSRE